MGLQESVARAFEPGAGLARSIVNFSPRRGQSDMAAAVAKVMESGGVLVVEAGTGVGKTFGYLVPALLSGERVLLSTATKTLQDQLFGRDIPRLTAALGVQARIALLKGRASYLCLHRLAEARHVVAEQDRIDLNELAQIEVWSLTTRSGDLAELVQLDDGSPLVPMVTSTRENCMGAQCPEVDRCHVNLARRQAMAADIVVVNHHLFFADLNIRESGVAELLPSVRSVVFDEAHQLNDIGVQFLGRQVTTHQLDVFCRELARQGPKFALYLTDWVDWLQALQRSVDALRQLFSHTGREGRIAWIDGPPSGVDGTRWERVIIELHACLQQTDVVLRSMEDATPDIKALQERAQRLTGALDVFSHPVQPGWVRWVDIGLHVKLIHSPLCIADSMEAICSGTSAQTMQGKSWIFTSATLGHDATMAHFLEDCGLQHATVLQVQSPFDYAMQAALYVPSDMPDPGESNHSRKVADFIGQAATVLGGRTLVLTTSLRAMRDIAAFLRQIFSVDSTIEVLVQGESSKRELMQRFCMQGKVGQKGFVLIGAASFWEGVDVPGDALQMVVIDKLPFSPPDDPLVKARAQSLASNAKNPFYHFHVPQAALALKQGAGRLIRQETDRGVLVVCDKRLTEKAYGRKIRAALPPMRVLEDQEQLMAALQELTKTSTMNHC